MPVVFGTLREQVQALEDGTRWAFAHLRCQDNGFAVSQALINEQAIGVSDGSLKMLVGTSAFVLEGSTEEPPITGANQVPGPIKEGDSHRCELAGIFALITMFNEVAKRHHITKGKATIYCDNIRALDVLSPTCIPNPNNSSFDLFQAVYKAVQDSPLTFVPKHEKGHQDDHVSIDSLSHTAQLNVKMDILAKAYWRTIVHSSVDWPTPSEFAITGEGWTVWSPAGKVVQPTVEALYTLIHNPITRAFWEKKGRIPHDLIEEIDWQATERHLKSLNQGRRMWVPKHASEECGVGVTLVKWKYQRDDTCPRCDEPETTAHVLKCRGLGADQLWDSNVIKTDKTLKAIGTCPELRQAILLNLDRWRKQLPPVVDDFEANVQVVINQQHRLGWKAMLEGLMVKDWANLQQVYYTDTNDRRSTKQWTRRMNKALHHLAWGMWEHRNNIKHRDVRPRDQLANRHLNQQIVSQWTQGPDCLPTGDHHHFNIPLAPLLRRGQKNRQAWLANVLAARQRQARIDEHDDELNNLSVRESNLLQWMKTKRH
jgi:hypothetical protein